MYRFLLGPKWLAFHLLVIVAVIVMVNLGFWQLHRLDQRQTFNAVIEERYDLPAEPLDDVLRLGVVPDEVAWRPVTTMGTYLPDQGLLVVNRSQGGRAGADPVVPLGLDDGRILLVNRGFVPLGEETPPVPATEVEITGRLRPSQERRLGQLSDPAEGVLREVQRLNVDRLSAQFDAELVPMYVLARVSALGVARCNIAILSHALPSGVPLDGLLGLHFLRCHRLMIDFRHGVITLE